MRPFWIIVIGLGVTWFITSGRAGAALSLLLTKTAATNISGDTQTVIIGPEEPVTEH